MAFSKLWVKKAVCEPSRMILSVPLPPQWTPCCVSNHYGMSQKHTVRWLELAGGRGACMLGVCYVAGVQSLGACFQMSPSHQGSHGPALIQAASQKLCWYAAESPDDPGRRRLRSGSKVNTDASSPVIAEQPGVRRSKRKSRQTLESSDDDGGTDGQPAAKRHLDLQPNDQVCSGC